MAGRRRKPLGAGEFTASLFDFVEDFCFSAAAGRTPATNIAPQQTPAMDSEGGLRSGDVTAFTVRSLSRPGLL